MNFYEYYAQDPALENPSLTAAVYLASIGFKVLPCTGKEPTDQIRTGVKQINKLRIKPLHEKNILFYFSDPHNIAVLTGDKLEVIDIDCKYDLTGRLQKDLFSAIKYNLEDAWRKLVIQKSASGGYHIFYKCNQIAGPLVFAQREATPTELSNGERVKVLIETRGEGGYIMVCPTPGYKFVKGTPADIDFITPEERAELVGICKSFNKLPPVVINEYSNKQNGREDAPWNVFNKQNGWEYTLEQLIARGWDNVREEEDKIMILRPGSNAKSSGVIWKDSGILFLFSTSTEFQAQVGYTPFSVNCQLNYSSDFKECCRQLAEQGVGSFEGDDGEFFFINDKGNIKLKLRQIIMWLNDIGIRKYIIGPTTYEIVQVIENRVKIIDLNYIKKIFCSYIQETCNETVDNFFLKSFAAIFNREGIINLVNNITDDDFIKPMPQGAYILFKNAVIYVTGNDIKYVHYANLDGLVWQDNIIQREIKPADPTKAEAFTFIKNVSNQDEKRINMLRSLIGYMLHPFKDPANPRAAIINDEFFSEENEEPQGGTGKGMFIKLLSHFRRVVSLDGKTFSFDKSFMYQRITPATDLVCFEDVHRGFSFEKLFSVITEGWIIERKRSDEYIIPFEYSPKILITSNYVLKGFSASHQRRRYEVEISRHYTPENTVKDEFGHLFFIDWDVDQWACFDNMMLDCLQFYLLNGFSKQTHINLEVKRLIEETSYDFCQWIDTLPEQTEKIAKDDFMAKFTILYPDWNKKLTQTRFTRWLNKYCLFAEIVLDATNSYNGKMVYHFKNFGSYRRKIFPSGLNGGNAMSGTIDVETKTTSEGSAWQPLENEPF